MEFGILLVVFAGGCFLMQKVCLPGLHWIDCLGFAVCGKRVANITNAVFLGVSHFFNCRALWLGTFVFVMLEVTIC